MISIIIPTLDEEEGIAKVICSIPEEIRKKSEVIVVDVSDDMTPVIAERLGAKVLRAGKKGKGRQMRLAAKAAKGEILVFLDGDGTDPPSYIPMLLEELKSANLVLGCRNLRNFEEDDKNLRRIFKLYGIFIAALFRVVGFEGYGDPLAGFRAIRKKDWDRLALKSNDFRIETEMNIKAVKKGFVIKEMPIPHLKRSGGGLRASKLLGDPKQVFEIYKLILAYFTEDQLKKKIVDFESKIKLYAKRYYSHFQ
ncbi:MAG: glycosyl transferase [Parcubacteria group bacterium Gr01-1014_30]|nr:MAG: glycosyl transferase [Parcubacteria group bacterium Gr01-1014_30]